MLVIMLPFFTLADEPIKEGVDVILLIDTSGSMRSSDNERNAIEAVNMFIDMLQTKHSRVSVLAFNDEIAHVVEMTEINSVTDKEQIKNTVNNFKYDGYTDIGVPLREGVDKLTKDVRPQNSSMILLLTDGKIETDPEREDRTEHDSYQDITEALFLASKNFPIYTIGLNYDNSVDRQLLETISKTTKGRNYTIDESSVLPQIFNEIFADHIESSLIEVASFATDGSSFNEVMINIESDFVSEANIIMLSGQELSDVKLFDPNGIEAAFNQETITYSKSNKYSIIKVIAPSRGVWILKAKGVKDDKVRVNLLYQYDVAVEISVSQEEKTTDLYNSLAPIQIKGHLIVNGQPYNESLLYNETTTELIVERENDIIATIPLTIKDNTFFGEYTSESTENIKLYIKTEHEHFAKQSNTFDIEFEKIATDQPIVVPSEDPAVLETPAPTEDKPKKLPWRLTLLITVIIAAIVIALIHFQPWNTREEFFTGYIELRMKDSSGKYTPVEAPLLDTYVNSFTMYDFVADNLKKSTVNKFLKLPFDLKQIVFYAENKNGVSAINIDNKTDCQILVKGNNDKPVEKKFVWKSGEQIVLMIEDRKNSAEIEMTYRIEEN